MSPMTTNRRYFSCLLGALLMLAPVLPLALTSCQNEHQEINLTVQQGFDGIAEAIRSMDKTLAEKLAIIESAVQNGLADNKTSQELIQQALASLTGSLAEKLAAIEAAVQAQTTSLEMKLALIEAAVKEGLASGATQQNLLKEAIESLGGTLAEKLAAIETAIKEQTSSLEAKLGLIEAAVRAGLADTASAQSLIKEAIESVGGTLAEKIAAVEKAVGSQTTELAAKLALIETAVKEGFAGEKGLQELIKEAIETLNGTAKEKLEALERAVTSQTSSLETKLGAIETALNDGIGDVVDAQGLIRDAISSLPGTLTEKLSAVEQAITGQTSSLDTKLGAIEQAVAKGFTDSAGKQDLIEQAIRSLGDTVEEVIGDLQEAMSGSLSNLETKLETIGTAVTDGFADATEALGLIKDAIDEAQKSIEGTNTSIGDVTKALSDVVKAIEDMDKTISDDVASVLSDILDAIANAPDYSTLLQDIMDAIEEINLDISIEFSDQYVENDVVMMLTEDLLSIPYIVTSNADITVTVDPSDDIAASVVPDQDKPLEGIIELMSGKSITEGKTQVVVTASSKKKNIERTLAIKEAYLTPVSSPVDSIPIGWQGGSVTIQYRTNLECAPPAIPDSASTLIKVLDTSVKDDVTTLTIDILLNDGYRPRLTSVTIKETRFNKAALTFTFWQQYEDAEIKFEDDGLRRKMIRAGVDTNGDDKISRAEARAVKSLTTIFGTELTDGAEYESFNELWYFTGIDTIPEGSFRNWKRLRNITLPLSITTIMGGDGDADGPFVNCHSLESISGKYSTADSTALIYDGKLLKVVEDFKHAPKQYEIPEGVKVIGSKAFYKSPLKNVIFPESLTTICDHAFEYSKIESVAFPMNDKGAAYVESIAENSFVHCFNLKSFVGPTKNGAVRVTPDNLGLYIDTTLIAFAMGNGTDNYVIPGDLGIKKLAASVFSVMDKNNKDEDVVNDSVELLLYLGLPSTLTHIGEHAFSGQTRQLSIYFEGENPPTMEKDVFDYAKDVTIWVPAGADVEETSARIASFQNAICSEDLHRIREILSYTSWPFAISTSASGTGENFVWD